MTSYKEAITLLFPETKIYQNDNAKMGSQRI